MDFKALELLETGGSWLGRIRSWIQWKKRNGSTVIWGSQEVLNPPVTVRELEEVAAISAAEAYADADKKRSLRMSGPGGIYHQATLNIGDPPAAEAYCRLLAMEVERLVREECARPSQEA